MNKEVYASCKPVLNVTLVHRKFVVVLIVIACVIVCGDSFDRVVRDFLLHSLLPLQVLFRQVRHDLITNAIRG